MGFSTTEHYSFLQDFVTRTTSVPEPPIVATPNAEHCRSATAVALSSKQGGVSRYRASTQSWNTAPSRRRNTTVFCRTLSPGQPRCLSPRSLQRQMLSIAGRRLRSPCLPSRAASLGKGRELAQGAGDSNAHPLVAPHSSTFS